MQTQTPEPNISESEKFDFAFETLGDRPLTFAEIVKTLSNPDFIDLTGQRFTRLVVQGYWGVSAQGRCGTKRMRAWTCKCDCGMTRVILANSLRRGKSRSCGCLRREKAAARFRALHFIERQMGDEALAGIERLSAMDHCEQILSNALGSLPKQP
jgi:hypothetical protein